MASSAFASAERVLRSAVDSVSGASSSSPGKRLRGEPCADLPPGCVGGVVAATGSRGCGVPGIDCGDGVDTCVAAPPSDARGANGESRVRFRGTWGLARDTRPRYPPPTPPCDACMLGGCSEAAPPRAVAKDAASGMGDSGAPVPLPTWRGGGTLSGLMDSRTDELKGDDGGSGDGLKPRAGLPGGDVASFDIWCRRLVTWSSSVLFTSVN